MNTSDMSRRHGLKATAALAAAWTLPSRVTAEGSGTEEGFLLSEHGCGRATGYAEANKIVTLGDRTHVVWLDSPQEGFRVRARTLDRRTGRWSPTCTVGEAADNHGGPALTADSQGFLHVVYYPHHHAMRYRKSLRPNDASQWEEAVEFGERLTYPTLVCGADDTLYLTARRSFANRPWQVELWKRPPDEAWRREGAILESRHRGYAHFQESLAWGPNRRALHLACRFHEKTDRKGYGRIQTVAYLVSRDFGKTWTHGDGRGVTLPATAESAEVIAQGGVDAQRMLRAGATAVDSQGRPHVVYSVEEHKQGETVIARLDDGGNWHRIDLRAFVPDRWSSWRLIMPGGVTFDDRGAMVVAAMLQRPEPGASTWGNPTNEVVAFRRDDEGRPFSFALLGRVDAGVSHWLPNIERPAGQHRIPAEPDLVYTAGTPGKTNRDLLLNQVFFLPVRR